MATEPQRHALRTQRMDRFDQRMDRFETLEHELVAEFRRQTTDQTRLLFFSMVGAIFTTASLAFAAVWF